MKIGFTCGAFDLLHAGHVVMLKEAKQNCDYLIVGLQTDPTLDRQEKNKPIQSMYERYIQLQAIKYIDEIIPYDTEKSLLDLLERFCTGSTSSSEVEDILRGKAIVSKTHTEFRINDLMEFLDRHRFKEFKLNEITAYLKNLGAEHSGKKIKGKFMNVWSIKNFSVQDEEFTQPKIEKEAYE